MIIYNSSGNFVTQYILHPVLNQSPTPQAIAFFGDGRQVVTATSVIRR